MIGLVNAFIMQILLWFSNTNRKEDSDNFTLTYSVLFANVR